MRDKLLLGGHSKISRMFLFLFLKLYMIFALMLELFLWECYCISLIPIDINHAIRIGVIIDTILKLAFIIGKKIVKNNPTCLLPVLIVKLLQDMDFITTIQDSHFNKKYSKLKY